MRLWHENLFPCLPRQQLLGQHRECCALRGKGWQKKHSTVDYIFNYSLERLVAYHRLVMEEMEDRNYNVTEKWYQVQYRGKQLGYDEKIIKEKVDEIFQNCSPIYPEHDDQYLKDCLENLQEKEVVCPYFPAEL